MPIVRTKAELLEALKGVPDDAELAVHGSWSDYFTPELTVRQGRGGKTVLVTLSTVGGESHYDIDYYPEKKV